MCLLPRQRHILTWVRDQLFEQGVGRDAKRAACLHVAQVAGALCDLQCSAARQIEARSAGSGQAVLRELAAPPRRTLALMLGFSSFRDSPDCKKFCKGSSSATGTTDWTIGLPASAQHQPSSRAAVGQRGRRRELGGQRPSWPCTHLMVPKQPHTFVVAVTAGRACHCGQWMRAAGSGASMCHCRGALHSPLFPDAPDATHNNKLAGRVELSGGSGGAPAALPAGRK